MSASPSSTSTSTSTGVVSLDKRNVAAVGAGMMMMLAAVGLGAWTIAKRRAVAAEAKAKADSVYETKKSLDEYLLMHFGTREDLMWYADGPVGALEFPKRCAQRCIDLASDPANFALGGSKARVLDLGCAVGRASFELARYFEDVTGIDYSHSFINAANRLKQEREIKYEMSTEGDLKKAGNAAVDIDIKRERCTFQQGDACALDVAALTAKGKFGLVLGANLVCRLPKPRIFLATIGSIIAPGGYLVLPSPYSWLEQFTPKSEWIGGKLDDKGVAMTTFEGLKAHLGGQFELVSEQNEPFLIRETHRKNQYTLSHVTVWKRKAN